MQYRGPNFYPPEGHDWVATNTIRRLRDHNEALMEEKYTHDASAFRQKFFAKLMQHGALNDGVGWAMFDDEESGSTSTLGRNETVLLSIPMLNEAMGDYRVPRIRIITNQQFISDGKVFYLADDVTVTVHDAHCFTSAVNLPTTVEEFGNMLTHSLTPLFKAVDGQLLTSNNFNMGTPIVEFEDQARPETAVQPFGNPEVLSDRIYALHKAQQILSSVMDWEPIDSYNPDNS